MSKIRTGLSFSPEASGIAQEAKSSLMQHHIEVIEVEDLTEAVDDYLSSELMLLVITREYVTAITRKHSELVLGPRENHPDELIVYSSTGPRAYSTDEVYSDTRLMEAFSVPLAEPHWRCLLLLEILCLRAYHQYVTETPFADTCLSILQGDLIAMLNQHKWEAATDLNSKLRRIRWETMRKLQVPSNVYMQIEQAVSEPIHPATAITTQALLKFALLATGLFPRELLNRAAQKYDEIAAYLKTTNA